MTLMSPTRTAAHYKSKPSEPNITERFAPFRKKMLDAGQSEEVTHTFRHYYTQLAKGATGYVSGKEAQPVPTLPTTKELATYAKAGQNALAQTAVIKLNGGLGTTMGMNGPKSLVQVKDNFTFLDIIVHQILYMRCQYDVRLPLILMNSFNTQKASEAVIKSYVGLWEQDVPTTFLQHQIPKIWKHDLSPVSWPDDPAKEWCPPGHGDLYLALQTSGLLASLLDQGYQYAFVSNADNLGATVDLSILGYFAEKRLPFLMEAARRQPADRKGGHLAYHPKQGLLLREVAQCPADELEEFQDIERYQYFNTNNLWIHLPTLQHTLWQYEGVLPLPLIRNEKAVDPTQPDSPHVYQLETAMGHAIALFPDAQAVEILRDRFIPVKNTNDLLALWSDAYVLKENYMIQRNPARKMRDELIVDLDKDYYGFFDQLKAHFQEGAPSLVHCRQFHVEGDIYFDANVALAGDVWLQNRQPMPLHLTNNH
jgi:UTP--glucose-1-phosphate uridylyltransferase